MTVIAWDGTSEYHKASYRAIRVDGRRFLSTTPISMSHLAAAVGRDSTYQFFQERETDRPDTLLSLTEVVALNDGDAFYGIPSCTFAAVEAGSPPPDDYKCERLGRIEQRWRERETLTGRIDFNTDAAADIAYLLTLVTERGAALPSSPEPPLYVYHGPPEGFKLMTFPELSFDRPVVLTAGDKLELRWVRGTSPAPPTVACARCGQTLPTHGSAFKTGEVFYIGPHECGAAPAPSPPDDFAQFATDARTELDRADEKWPDGDVYLRLAALAGEVGELAEGVIKQRAPVELRAEAVQVAVTAYRVARVLFAGVRVGASAPTPEPRHGIPELHEAGVAAAWKAFCADWPHEVNECVYPSLIAALCAYVGGIGSPQPAPDLEKFRRALQQLLYAHGEWATCRPSYLQREQLAEVACAAEEAVVALYEDVVRGASPQPPEGPTEP